MKPNGRPGVLELQLAAGNSLCTSLCGPQVQALSLLQRTWRHRLASRLTPLGQQRRGPRTSQIWSCSSWKAQATTSRHGWTARGLQVVPNVTACRLTFWTGCLCCSPVWCCSRCVLCAEGGTLYFPFPPSCAVRSTHAWAATPCQNLRPWSAQWSTKTKAAEGGTRSGTSCSAQCLRPVHSVKASSYLPPRRVPGLAQGVMDGPGRADLRPTSPVLQKDMYRNRSACDKAEHGAASPRFTAAVAW